MVFGNPEAVRNGEQLKRTKSLSVRFQALKNIEAKTDMGDLVVGRNIVMQCMKNKCGKSSRKTTCFYGEASSEFAEIHKTNVEKQIIELALTFGLVERKGAYYSFGETRVQGLDNFVKTLRESGVISDMESKVYEEMKK